MVWREPFTTRLPTKAQTAWPLGVLPNRLAVSLSGFNCSDQHPRGQVLKRGYPTGPRHQR